MEDSKMKKHVTMVAAIQIGFSVLGLIGSMILFFALSFARSQVGDDEVARNVLKILIITLPVVIGVMSLLGLTGGIGLFSYQPWARYLVIVVAALGCLNIPFGTAKGIYALWVLLQSETIKLFSGEKADLPDVH
jgi:O-antigen/teichoic acid export membrane protein